MSTRQRIAWVVAGGGFAAFPLLRPWGDKAESTAPAAATAQAMTEAFASEWWVVSHGLSMIAFLALTLGARALTSSRAGLLAGIGTALVLPYYGAETFGLHALGQWGREHGATAVPELADLTRNEPVAMTAFGVGFVILAAAGLLLARSIAHLGAPSRPLAVLVAAGLVSYLPQFFLPPAGRIAHGLVLGLALLALALLTPSAQTAGGTGRERSVSRVVRERSARRRGAPARASH